MMCLLVKWKNWKPRSSIFFRADPHSFSALFFFMKTEPMLAPGLAVLLSIAPALAFECMPIFSAFLFCKLAALLSSSFFIAALVTGLVPVYGLAPGLLLGLGVGYDPGLGPG